MKKQAQGWVLVALWGLLLAMSSQAWAKEVGGLYKASVPVKDRSDVERKRASAEGFIQVLVKASGDSTIGQQDAVTAAMGNAEKFMLQYGYATRNGETGEPQPVLNVDFDGNAINEFLRRSGLPLWSSNRQPLLVWMAWEQELDRDLVSAEANPGAHQILQQEATRRGVSLIFPAFDSEDRSSVSIGDVWGLFPEPVLAASARYQTQSILMARVKESAGSIQINALFHLDGQKNSLDITETDSTRALHQLLDQVVDLMGAHYALVSSNQGRQQLILDVEGVDDLNDFAALTQYLDGVLAISLYRMNALKGDHAEFLLTLESGLDALRQVLRVDGRLAPVEEAAAPAATGSESAGTMGEAAASTPEQAPIQAPTGTVVIRYRWQG